MWIPSKLSINIQVLKNRCPQTSNGIVILRRECSRGNLLRFIVFRHIRLSTLHDILFIVSAFAERIHNE